jgi:chaperone required for assembly of F1-ATPase
MIRALRTGRLIARKYSAAAVQATPAPTTEEKVAKAKLNRFWKSVNVAETDVGFTILLDGRALKTPNKTKIVVPQEGKVLALMAAAEWVHSSDTGSTRQSP